eukprot:jgi/Bigna1/72505/fgenesh1_pg.20_\
MPSERPSEQSSCRQRFVNHHDDVKQHHDVPESRKFFFESSTNSDSYHMQGDKRMYTQTAISKRNGLKEHPEVVAMIDKFFMTFPPEKTVLGLEFIPKKAYIEFYLKVAKCLYSDFDEPSSRKQAEEELQKDLEGATEMDIKLYRSSLFEIVDIWTITHDLEDYVSFLETLYERITYRQLDISEESIRNRKYRELDDIHFNPPNEAIGKTQGDEGDDSLEFRRQQSLHNQLKLGEGRERGDGEENDMEERRGKNHLFGFGESRARGRGRIDYASLAERDSRSKSKKRSKKRRPRKSTTKAQAPRFRKSSKEKSPFSLPAAVKAVMDSRNVFPVFSYMTKKNMLNTGESSVLQEALTNDTHDETKNRIVAAFANALINRKRSQPRSRSVSRQHGRSNRSSKTTNNNQNPLLQGRVGQDRVSPQRVQQQQQQQQQQEEEEEEEEEMKECQSKSDAIKHLEKQPPQPLRTGSPLVTRSKSMVSPPKMSVVVHTLVDSLQDIVKDAISRSGSPLGSPMHKGRQQQTEDKEGEDGRLQYSPTKFMKKINAQEKAGLSREIERFLFHVDKSHVTPIDLRSLSPTAATSSSSPLNANSFVNSGEAARSGTSSPSPALSPQSSHRSGMSGNQQRTILDEMFRRGSEHTTEEVGSRSDSVSLCLSSSSQANNDAAVLPRGRPTKLQISTGAVGDTTGHGSSRSPPPHGLSLARQREQKIAGGSAISGNIEDAARSEAHESAISPVDSQQQQPTDKEESPNHGHNGAPQSPPPPGSSENANCFLKGNQDFRGMIRGRSDLNPAIIKGKRELHPHKSRSSSNSSKGEPPIEREVSSLKRYLDGKISVAQNVDGAGQLVLGNHRRNEDNQQTPSITSVVKPKVTAAPPAKRSISVNESPRTEEPIIPLRCVPLLAKNNTVLKGSGRTLTSPSTSSRQQQQQEREAAPSTKEQGAREESDGDGGSTKKATAVEVMEKTLQILSLQKRAGCVGEGTTTGHSRRAVVNDELLRPNAAIKTTPKKRTFVRKDSRVAAPTSQNRRSNGRGSSVTTAAATVLQGYTQAPLLDLASPSSPSPHKPLSTKSVPLGSSGVFGGFPNNSARLQLRQEHQHHHHQQQASNVCSSSPSHRERRGHIASPCTSKRSPTKRWGGATGSLSPSCREQRQVHRQGRPSLHSSLPPLKKNSKKKKQRRPQLEGLISGLSRSSSAAANLHQSRAPPLRSPSRRSSNWSLFPPKIIQQSRTQPQHRPSPYLHRFDADLWLAKEVNLQDFDRDTEVKMERGVKLSMSEKYFLSQKSASALSNDWTAALNLPDRRLLGPIQATRIPKPRHGQQTAAATSRDCILHHVQQGR